MGLSALRLTRPSANGQAHKGNGNGAVDAPARPDPRRTTTARPTTQLAARIGLWALVGLGALGGLVGLLRPAAEPTVSDAGSSADDIVPPETAGFAEVAVTTWVEAQGDDADSALGPLYAQDPSTNAGDTGRRRVAGDATTIGARQVQDDYWAVTVAVPVEEAVDDGWQDAGTWYAEVGIARSDGDLVAVAEPALVPAPVEPADAPRPAGDSLVIPSQDDEEMANTVQGFLSALLANSGDVSRYLAPDVEILPITPAPFTEVALQRWDVTPVDDGEARVRVLARARSAGGVPRTLSYELGLAERAGRWEVTSLSGAPTIDADEGAPSSAGTMQSSTTTTAPTTTSVSIASEPGA